MIDGSCGGWAFRMREANSIGLFTEYLIVVLTSRLPYNDLYTKSGRGCFGVQYASRPALRAGYGRFLRCF